MTDRTVAVASAHGLHARPAALFVQEASAAGIPVTLGKGERRIDATSILGVISLGVSHGDEVTLSADGDGADALLDRLEAILATDQDAAVGTPDAGAHA